MAGARVEAAAGLAAVVAALPAAAVGQEMVAVVPALAVLEARHRLGTRAIDDNSSGRFDPLHFSLHAGIPDLNVGWRSYGV